MVDNNKKVPFISEVEIFGTQGHIAYPHLSNNPINTLIKTLLEIQTKKNILLDGGQINNPAIAQK